ncbi:MAG: hypothetical protein CBC35_05010 [Planctomycetes bacterium TMED75]|nr:hypothetical protein [Planctomycetaceae bacterium]OUU93717.1 MAG: hypothetical protein CBC35_05010 [Planctomycetes bacterium TMED75]
MFQIAANCSRTFAALIGLCAVLCSPLSGHADVGELEKRLNELLLQNSSDPNSTGRVTESGLSAKPLIEAYLAMSPPPVPVGADFNLTTIWPGMNGWEAVSNWAAANEKMAEVITEVQGRPLLGMRYGRSNVPAAWSQADILIDVAPGGDLALIAYPYLDAMDVIISYATAEFYRRLEAGEYTSAFEFGLAYLRILRQGCEQDMLDEKLWFMDTLSVAFSTHRDAMYAYLDRIPSDVYKNLGTKEYPFLKATDDQRLRRLELPEGDRIHIELLLESAFDSRGQADREKFAEIFGSLQARQKPFGRFGTKKQWARLAEYHSTLDLSKEKLEDVYDDWWRRWRYRQFEGIMDLPNEFSKLNEIRYAAIRLAVTDLEEIFFARERLVSDINGTIFSAGLCAFHQQYQKWPRDLAPVAPAYAMKRFNFDPYNTEYGEMVYVLLNARKPIETRFGQLWAEGCLLYTLGRDNIDAGARQVSDNGEIGSDLLLWPPTRQLAREQGKIQLP